MFNSMEQDDRESNVEAITQYVERATSAEYKISEMENELSQIKLTIQNSHAAYIDSQQQAFQALLTQIQTPTYPGP